MILLSLGSWIGCERSSDTHQEAPVSSPEDASPPHDDEPSETSPSSAEAGASDGDDPLPHFGGGTPSIAVEGPTPPPDFASLNAPEPSFTRGINFGNRLDAPSEGALGPVIGEGDFALVAARGFDHIRLPVRFSAHAEYEAPYTIDQPLFERVDWAITRGLESGLSIVVALHSYHELMSDPDDHRERFVAFWEQIAERYADAPPALAFELLHHPIGALLPRYNDLVAETLPVVKAPNPDRLIIVSAPDYAAPSALSPETAENGASLELPEGLHEVWVTVHLYDPVLFFLQGALWEPMFSTHGIVFPGPPSEPIVPVPAAASVEWVAQWFEDYNSQPTETNPCSPAAIRGQLDMVVAYRERTGYPVYVGEWGTGDNTDQASRLEFSRVAQEELAARDLPWALWEDNGGSWGLFDGKAGTWVEPLVSVILGEE